MSAYKTPIKDMEFLLNDVFKAPALFASMPGTEEVSIELITTILQEAAKITEGLIAPLNHSGDLEACRLVDGQVFTPKGFKQVYAAYAAGGWTGLTGAVEYGGQGMPKMLSALLEEMLFAANSSFALYSILTTGASLALQLHGSEELKQRYLPKLYSGIWTGSMCLTEAQAGTDLGMIQTKAVEDGEGNYRITGSKIFITAGEHDLSENIIHLVLAKLPGAPAGPRGISLFLVPKILIKQSGELGELNGVSCGSLEHKMGIKASATCVLNFDAAQGYLVGELNHGLNCMFTMMNYERLSMGLQGTGLADSSYQIASQYAKERLQGRGSNPVDRGIKAADPIIVHPDVRRMLLTMRANIMAGRALSIYTASKLDIAHFHDEAQQRELADDLVALLIPVVKAYCSDRGFESCVLGQQVLGGHGYIAEWGLEQNVRDARIAQIYEGTNGVQALDLMGRKIIKSKGLLLQTLFAEMRALDNSAETELLSRFAKTNIEARQALLKVTELVIANAAQDTDEIGAASYAYMELLGLLLYGFMWQKILLSANDEVLANDLGLDYVDSLNKTGQFFLERLMPRYKFLVEEISAGAATLMAMRAEQF